MEVKGLITKSVFDAWPASLQAEINEKKRREEVGREFPPIYTAMIKDAVAGYDLIVGTIIPSPFAFGYPCLRFRIRRDRELEILAGNWDPNPICEVEGIKWDL